MTSEKTGDDGRRVRLLDAAVGVFLRYGFRKTSMDEVARAADVSRQALYLHFDTKEQLFRAAVEHAVGASARAAEAAFADTSRDAEGRLVAGLDAWMGRFAGAPSQGMGDIEALLEQREPELRELLRSHEQRVVEAMAKCLRATGLAAAYKPAGLTARQLAETLYATGRGTKHAVASRAEFVTAMELAARALCLPLRAG